MLRIWYVGCILFLHLTCINYCQTFSSNPKSSEKDTAAIRWKTALPYRLRSLPNLPYAESSTNGQQLQTSSPQQYPSASSSTLMQIESQSTLIGDVSESWVRRYTASSMPSQDYANAIVTDRNGNVYITGVSYSTISGADYLTIKYNSQGDTVWTRRYNGPMNAYDEATAIGVDSSNDVYVTGYSYTGNNGYDAITLKYRGDGTQVWVKQFNSSLGCDDIPVTMVVTNDHGIFLAGYSYQQNTGNDILIIKYSSDGSEQWVRLFNGPANDDDRATAMTVDSLGNVFVVGFSKTNTTGIDLLTLKYDNSGTNVWSDRYASSGDGIDVATDVALDHRGYTYVTGYSYQPSTLYDCVTIQYDNVGTRMWVSRFNGSLNGNDIATTIGVGGDNYVYIAGSMSNGTALDDFITIKYDMNGSIIWKAQYNDPSNRSDVAIDLIIGPSDGNIYVTGWIHYQAGSSKDITTIAYSTSGVTLWIDSYGGDGLGNDYPVSLAFDPFGNLYVAGCSYGFGSAFDYVVLKYIINESGIWPSRYGIAQQNLWLSKITTDAYGNVYAAGTDSVHIVVVKYDTLGAILWSRSVGSIHSDAASIAVDGTGNVVVAGSTTGEFNNLDYFIIKYDADGSEQWTRFYNGTAGGTDHIDAMKLDPENNIYVAGTSAGIGSKNDIVTIKYSSEGNELWSARFNGINNLNEAAVGLVIDSDQNVYVEGTGIRLGTSYDFLTIKYDYSGTEVWERYYNGPGSKSDFARAIAIDRNNNIYATGRSWGKTGLSDIATIKFRPDGSLVWAVRYDGLDSNNDDPAALTVDNDLNVYITGSTYSSSTNLDYVTLKYDSMGAEQWRALYNGPGNGIDYSSSICIDEEHNVYVTGSSSGAGTRLDYATLKYSTDGKQLCVARYNDWGNMDDNATQIILTGDQYLYIAGSSSGNSANKEFLIQKLSSAGISLQHWPTRYDGPGVSLNSAKSLSMDTDGNLIIGGTNYALNANENFKVIKYAPDGSMIFDAGWNASSGDDNITAMTTDRVNNIYVTGTLYPFLGPSYYGTAKFSSDGSQVWLSEYTGVGNGYNFSTAIAVDDSGNSYVTGYSYGDYSYDYATVKYNSSGEVQWTARYNGTAGIDDLATSLVLDKSGNVYVTGCSYGSEVGTDFATIKYNTDGVLQWVARYNGPTTKNARAQSIIIDSSSNIVVTGWTVGADTTYDCSTLKYDTSGALLWADNYSSGLRSNEIPYTLACDAQGNIFVAGTMYTSDLKVYNYLILKYDRDGNRLWQNTYSGTTDGENVAMAIALDDSGNAYVTGKSIGDDGKFDYATVRCDDNGTRRWTARYTTAYNCDDLAYAIKVDHSGNVYVTGTSQGSDWSIITTIKYSQTSTGVDTGGTTLPKTFQLSQNYPNPFNPESEITYSLPQQTHVVLKIYNILGQDVKTLVDEIQNAGTKRVYLNAQTFAAGVYFYRLITSNGFSDTKKMLVVK